MPYRFIDVPGMAHENAPASAFEEALTWILGKPEAAAPVAAKPAATGGSSASTATPSGTDPLALLTTQRRTWTAANGSTIEATYVRMNGSSVVLRPDDGQLRVVPVSALSAADQALLRPSQTSPCPTFPPPIGGRQR